MKKKLLIGLLIALWGCSVIWGMLGLWSFSRSAGQPGDPPRFWPACTTLAQAKQKPTLLFFLHPQCGCSQASVEELTRVMTHVQAPLQAKVIYLDSDDKTSQWSDSSLLKRARSIPGVEVIVDPLGQQSQCFEVQTSGHVLLYNRTGQLIYSGGITSGRGHAGSNSAEVSLIDQINSPQEQSQFKQFAVYGCSLFKVKFTELRSYLWN